MRCKRYGGLDYPKRFRSIPLALRILDMDYMYQGRQRSIEIVRRDYWVPLLMNCVVTKGRCYDWCLVEQQNVNCSSKRPRPIYSTMSNAVRTLYTLAIPALSPSAFLALHKVYDDQPIVPIDHSAQNALHKSTIPCSTPTQNPNSSQGI
jgi:hypothetical protein